MHLHAMTITDDSERVIAQAARADAATAEAQAIRESVDMLLIELRHVRAQLRAHVERLETIHARAISAIPHTSDERAARALGDIAVRAMLPVTPVSLHAVRPS
jgi:hypothetical protein